MNRRLREVAQVWDVVHGAAQDRERLCLGNVYENGEVTDAECFALSSELCEENR